LLSETPLCKNKKQEFKEKPCARSVKKAKKKMKNKYRILKIAITVIILGFLLSFSLKKFSGQKITDNKISVKMNEKTPVYFIDEKDIRKL
jgi:cell division protein FtsQ